MQLPPKLAVSQGSTSAESEFVEWMGEQGKIFWQEGYGAFSVSSSNLDQVTRYIQNQEVHHRKTSFEENFVRLLRKHGVEYDPNYAFG